LTAYHLHLIEQMSFEIAKLEDQRTAEALSSPVMEASNSLKTLQV
jgi:hypothetical protein